jgi:hypothetical protein
VRKQRHPKLPEFSLALPFSSIISGKSANTFFLNCTKNTELTRARFARTVTFALAKHSNPFQPLRQVGIAFSKRIQHHAAHTLSGRAP